MPILWLAKTIQRDVYKLLDNFELLVQEKQFQFLIVL